MSTVFYVLLALSVGLASAAPSSYTVSNSDGFSDAAKLLLAGLDLTVDPCEDFYAFTCNTFLKNATIPPGASRIGTYDQSQENVNNQISTATAKIDSSSSLTEQIFKHAYDSCITNFNSGSPDLSSKINTQLLSQLGGLPLASSQWSEIGWSQFWTTLGKYESQYGVGSLFSSYVSVNYGNTSIHALYINQGGLAMPRDYYTKNENRVQADNYLADLTSLAQLFNKAIGGTTSNDDIAAAVIDAVQFEILLALAEVPDDLLRNYHQQYNVYSLADLEAAYPNIDWNSYISGLLVDVSPAYKRDEYVVVQPAFFGAIDSMIGGKRVSQKTLANFVGLRLLTAVSDFIGGDFRKLSRSIRKFQTNKRTKQPIRFFDEASQNCVDYVSAYMPYGAGYIYVKNIENRDQVRADVARQTDLVIEAFLNMTKTLKWIDEYSLNNVMAKNKQLVKNIGWPWWFSFTSSQYIDNAYHAKYHDILKINDFFDLNLALNKASQQTENFGLLEKKPDRENFGGPPSEVNAWYIPERNSITFPFAAFNPPYYRYDFPQAYNYAGQGGTAGHELTHGYDDEGVQFGAVGALSDCTWESCGWMDKNSTLGFINMAQCVVSQFSEKCCPLKTGNVHCANGANTQGENIADLGGQQAAYKAYRKYVEVDRKGVEEDRLPGLTQFTPNQIFWITYGYSWCMLQEDANLVHQLLTNPHAPGVCRVNQVMRDIPEFAKDFSCAAGKPMFPADSDRCHVWTDAPL
uniref:Peptidase_M13 domain-containing protein n=1 Tax=Panagrellus redivivus TaxID=6233 RepID=A0A7E4VJT0_PANRE